MELPKNSLKKLSRDDRDYNLGAVFGQIKIEDVPTYDFVSADPIRIKDQGDTDYCSAYALTAVSEDQEGVELYPEYQFFKTKLLTGKFKEWGADLRDACKSARDFGSLPMRYKINEGLSRNELLKPERWSSDLDELAKPFKKDSFFIVKGRYDTFDNIRAALWQHRDECCSVLTGAEWRQSWLDSTDGILPPIYEENGEGHAFKIFGQKTIKERMYLMAQLSQGDKVGDKGIFYLSREIINKEVGPYGMFMFKDLPKGDVEIPEGTETQKVEPKMSFWDWIKSLFRKKSYA